MRRSNYARICRKYLTKKVLTDLHQLRPFRYTILKTSQVGEFRCQVEVVGSTQELETKDVPLGALDAVQNLVRYMKDRFESLSQKSGERNGKGLVYVRIDGIMKGYVFILMEIEAIELQLWLEADSCSIGMAELCNFFLPSA